MLVHAEAGRSTNNVTENHKKVRRNIGKVKLLFTFASVNGELAERSNAVVLKTIVP
jgi:hypothetical protein